jgi:Xaa-Pro dipeptidase
MGLDLSEYPRFSQAERERRWGRVQELMRERDCAVLIAPAAREAEQQTTSRYLSQIGGAASAWVIFPLEGEPTAILESERNRDFMARAQDWIADLRVGEPTDLIPDRLKELGLDRGRIGLTQFRGHYRGESGVIPYDTVRELMEALPQAELYGENEVLNLARVVKGPEEVEVIKRITRANEEAIRLMFEQSRPDRRQEDVWFSMHDVMVRAGRGAPARLSVTFGGGGNVTLGMAVPDVIKDGDLCSQEICTRIQGYRAQCNHTFKAGRGGPADYEDVMKHTIEIYNEVVAWLKPGVTVRELMQKYDALCEEHGGRDASGVCMHTNGLGDDYPRLGPRLQRGAELDLAIQPGFTFTFKPVLRFPSGTSTQYGDPLTITESGAQRLGTRDQVPVVV